MTFSGSRQPDLDWSQIRETVKLLAVSVAQVEGSMKAGDESVEVLATSFAKMVDDMNAVREILATLAQRTTRSGVASLRINPGQDLLFNRCLSVLR